MTTHTPETVMKEFVVLQERLEAEHQQTMVEHYRKFERLKRLMFVFHVCLCLVAAIIIIVVLALRE